MEYKGEVKYQIHNPRTGINENKTKACTINISPSITNCIVILNPSLSINCGKKAKKNRDTLNNTLYNDVRG